MRKIILILLFLFQYFVINAQYVAWETEKEFLNVTFDELSIYGVKIENEKAIFIENRNMGIFIIEEDEIDKVYSDINNYIEKVIKKNKNEIYKKFFYYKYCDIYISNDNDFKDIYIALIEKDELVVGKKQISILSQKEYKELYNLMKKVNKKEFKFKSIRK